VYTAKEINMTLCLHGKPTETIALEIDRCIKDYFNAPKKILSSGKSKKAALTFYPLSKNLRVIASTIASNLEFGAPTKLSYFPRKGEYFFVKRNLGWRNWYPWIYVRNAKDETMNNKIAWSKYFVFPDSSRFPKVEYFESNKLNTEEMIIRKIAIKVYAMSLVFEFSDEFKARIAEVTPVTLEDRLEYVGVHIRRGDVISVDGRWSRNDWPIIPVEEFAKSAMLMAESFGTKNIFLATDSFETVEQFRSYCYGYNVMVNTFDREYFFRVDFNSVEDVETYIAKNPDKCDFYALSGVSDLFMLSKALGLVCTINSEFSKTAWYLAMATQKKFVEFKSLTVPLDLEERDSIYLV
jgi:hypothetical protein